MPPKQQTSETYKKTAVFHTVAFFYVQNKPLHHAIKHT